MRTVIAAGHDIAVHIDEIPEHEMAHLARATLHAVEEYFRIPGVQEDYEKWLIEYEKRKQEQK